MNVQKVNLGLTVELMNRREDKVSLKIFKNFMKGIKEAGEFLGTNLREERNVGNEWKNSDYTLNFENCSLNVNLTSNLNTRKMLLRSFKVFN